MAKPERPILIRQSFSHARTKPVVERLGRDNNRTTEKPSLTCSTCGMRMKLVHRAATIGAPATLLATCARCAGRSDL